MSQQINSEWSASTSLSTCQRMLLYWVYRLEIIIFQAVNLSQPLIILDSSRGFSNLICRQNHLELTATTNQEWSNQRPPMKWRFCTRTKHQALKYWKLPQILSFLVTRSKMVKPDFERNFASGFQSYSASYLNQGKDCYNSLHYLV